MKKLIFGLLVIVSSMTAQASCNIAYINKAEKLYPSAFEGWDSSPLCVVVFLTAGSAVAPGIGTLAALPVVAACYAYIGHSERLHNVSDLLFSSELKINADKIYKKLERKVKRRIEYSASEDLKPLILSSIKKLNNENAFCPSSEKGKTKLASLNDMADLIADDLNL